MTTRRPWPSCDRNGSGGGTMMLAVATTAAIRRQEPQVRSHHEVGDRRDLVGRLLGRLDEAGDRRRRRGQDEHPAGGGLERMEPIFEPSRDAEVAAAAADRPEEVGVALL